MTRLRERLERLRTGPARFALWGVAVALVAAPFAFRPPEETEPVPVLRRLLGPFANTAANVQWARADHAWRRGRHADGYALAASALDFAPDAPGGWIFLARHFAYERAAVEREADPALRRLWMQAAFDALDRGAATADGHGALSFERGVLFAYLAEVAAAGVVPESERPWRGTPDELYAEAARAYELAARKGDPDAAEAASAARARREELHAHDR
ncbi:MAG: hypothetical protein IPJ77_06900 [Planctomycetes bacterium]|nr:hypothetical protein [Planctomycetota bacterium]